VKVRPCSPSPGEGGRGACVSGFGIQTLAGENGKPTGRVEQVTGRVAAPASGLETHGRFAGGSGPGTVWPGQESKCRRSLHGCLPLRSAECRLSGELCGWLQGIRDGCHLWLPGRRLSARDHLCRRNLSGLRGAQYLWCHQELFQPPGPQGLLLRPHDRGERILC